MIVSNSIKDVYTLYERLGGVREDTQRGVIYRFPGGCGAKAYGRVELCGDPASLMFAKAAITIYEGYLSRTQLRQKYMGFSINNADAVETYRRRDEKRTLDAGLHFYVCISTVPFFMRVPKGAHLTFTALYFFEDFFTRNNVSLPADFWPLCDKLLNAETVFLPTLSALCRQIESCSLSGAAFDLFLRGQGLAAAGMIMDYMDRSRTEPCISLRREDHLLLEQAKQILKKELIHPPTISVLSSMVGINKNKLQEGFRLTEGKSVSEYLRAVRVERAVELLTSTSLPVEKIAAEVGYHSKANFYHTFQNVYGYTPGQLRGMMAEEKRTRIDNSSWSK